jgi:ribose 5-phosphate isomerase B
MRIYIGADHRGFELKEKVKKWLAESNITEQDVGALTYDQTDDYPDFASEVALKVAKDKEARGIVICGSGVGVDIAANKIKGIRCGFGHSAKQIESARSHDNINVLAIPADYLGENDVKEIVKAFLNTDYVSEERHQRRIDKIAGLES